MMFPDALRSGLHLRTVWRVAWMKRSGIRGLVCGWPMLWVPDALRFSGLRLTIILACSLDEAKRNPGLVSAEWRGLYSRMR